MATEDTKISDLKTDEAKSADKPELPKSEGSADEPAKTEDTVKDERPFADILKDAESKTSVEDSVKSLLEGVTLEFQAKAADGEKAVHDLADKITENAAAFADAVAANTEPDDAGKPTMAQRGLVGEPLAPGDTSTGAPHNPAAKSAVVHGMDVETANKMTAPGTNS